MKKSRNRPKPGAAGLDQGEVRRRLEAARQRMTLRDLGGAIGVTHYTIRKFLQGEPVRPSTLRRIAVWLNRKRGDDGLVFRDLLRRVVGRLPAREAKEVEREVGTLLSLALRAAGLDTPSWIDRIVGH